MTYEHNENVNDLEDSYSENLNSDDVMSQIKPSLISEGFEFTGEIRGSGSLSVEGVMNGKLVVNSLTVGAQGTVGGEVSAESVNVKGRFSGQMVCQDITLGGVSVVDADLTYSSIVVQRGGVLKGDVHKK